jgi:hypothetical protein
MANKAAEIVSAEERKEIKHRRHLMRLRHYSKVHFDTIVEDLLKPQKCSKDQMAMRTERYVRGVGAEGITC